MTAVNTLSRWQRAGSLAVEGACLLPYIAWLPLSVRQATQPPPLAGDPAALLPLIIAALLYSGITAPLKLWRAAWYSRLCHAQDGALPSLRLPPRPWRAYGWRWQLWWRRAGAILLGGLPAALLWQYGSRAAIQADSTQPLLWLLLGGIALPGGMLIVCVWQCRYALIPYYILSGESVSAAPALSIRTMHARRAQYINFLGAWFWRLLACLAIIPAAWIIPAFRRQHTALLLSWL